MLLRRAVVVLTCLLPASVLAGAWPAPEGGGQTIVTNTRKVQDISDIAGGGDQATRTEINLFAEYGVTQDTTVGLVIFGGFDDATFTDVELQVGGHVRHRFWTSEGGDVAAVQVGAGFPAERWLGYGLGDDRPQSVTEVYVSLLYGTSWQTRWTNGFISSGIEFRSRGEGLDDEVKFFATGGLQPFDRLMFLLDVAATDPLGDLGTSSLKLTPSVAFSMNPWLGDNDKKPDLASPPTTLQFGLTWDVRAPSDGIAFNIGIWRPF
ncbi:MAG: hypothetical protein AAF479_11745 [Pseudomonadota bacterium]